MKNTRFADINLLCKKIRRNVRQKCEGILRLAYRRDNAKTTFSMQ